MVTPPTGPNLTENVADEFKSTLSLQEMPHAASLMQDTTYEHGGYWLERELFNWDQQRTALATPQKWQ